MKKHVLFSSLLLLSTQLLSVTAIHAQNITLSGPAGSGQFGKTITVLTNGNYVITDPGWDNGATADVGAVYLYNGQTHTLISTLTGSTASDQVGSGGITPLTNGNYVVKSPNWDGTATNVGAVTWGNGASGVSGIVSGSNSLIGSTANDQVGSNGITVVTNSNYVVSSPIWDGTAADVGAATWANGATGITGLVSSSNSLVGSTASDFVGSGGITVLTNGNYVVKSPNWDGTAINVGAVTWGNGAIGVKGLVSSSNSLVGSTANDNLGGGASGGLTVLTNGNYVVRSPDWDGTAANVGAVTWGNGTTGITGLVSSSNSLVGSAASDVVGNNGVTALTNGNYVVGSSLWNGAVSDVGAATWGNGTTGIRGLVSSSNSLIGSTANDRVGSSGITALTNGNYVVSSQNWDGAAVDVGAVTWGNGTTGITGPVSSINSLVGSTANDIVGIGGNITALTNGNYVVRSPNWGGTAANAGAVTWGNGTSGVKGVVSSSNSLVGSTVNDQVGNNVIALTNGNYVVSSQTWDGVAANIGAVTWGNGTTGITGPVSSSNSLVGTNAGDVIGNSGIFALTNGNYLVTGQNGFGGPANAGAVTWGNGATGITGPVSSSNSLVGSTTGDNVGRLGCIFVLSNGNYIVGSPTWDGTAVDVGAVTWGNGATGTVGPVSSSNSQLGSTANDQIGFLGSVTALSNGDYIVKNSTWTGIAAGSGAYTLSSGATPLTGTINSCNSVLGGIANSVGSSVFAYNTFYDYAIAGLYLENKAVIFSTTSQQVLATATTSSTQTLSGTGKVPFTDASCQLIGSLQQSGVSPVTGAVAGKVYVESSAPTYNSHASCRRHYDFSPAANATTATGTVTLYFTQSDFNDYNSNNNLDPDLPASSSDVTGISNLRIRQEHGNSATGDPGSYSGGAVVIDPADNNIVWNNTLSRWEVTFNVTGFSGFFATGINSVALPVKLLSFNATVAGVANRAAWQTATEERYTIFEVERSGNALDFSALSEKITGKGDNSSYSFNDNAPLSPLSYYRLKITEAGGIVSYSNVIAVHRTNATSNVTVAPVPAASSITITSNDAKVNGTIASICDMRGVELYRFTINATQTVNVAGWPTGVYYLRIATGEVLRIIKE